MQSHKETRARPQNDVNVDGHGDDFVVKDKEEASLAVQQIETCEPGRRELSKRTLTT